jgi:glycine cleavage system H protein
MAHPADRLYTKTHEWVQISGDVATMGISSYAQEQLGDVVFVESPPIGKTVAQNEVVGNIESVKAVSEVMAAVAGMVVEVNAELDPHPELVNSDPHGQGWLVRLKVGANAASGLMDAAAYEKYLAEEGAH